MRGLVKTREQMVAAATRASGFEEGLRFDHSVKPSRSYKIEVSFYPTTKWWYRSAEHDGAKWKLGKREPLTQEFYQKLEKLRL